MIKMKKLILATVLVLVAACEGTPFNPYGKSEVDECHPEKWIDMTERSADSLLLSYQAACKLAREQGNSR